MSSRLRSCLRDSDVVARLGGVERVFRARGEVIVSAGAIMSPKILQLSGIGPAQLLHSLGVKVVVDSPDVGARMREHLGFLMTYRLKGDKGINHRYYGAGLFKSMLQYLALRTGPMATGPFEVGAFITRNPPFPDPMRSCIWALSPCCVAVRAGAQSSANRA